MVLGRTARLSTTVAAQPRKEVEESVVLHVIIDDVVLARADEHARCPSYGAVETWER